MWHSEVVLADGPILSPATLAIHTYWHVRQYGEARTSATVRNRSGLSSVMILLTRLEWQRMTRMTASWVWYSISPVCLGLPAAFSQSNTRTWLSPATVTLGTNEYGSVLRTTNTRTCGMNVGASVR